MPHYTRLSSPIEDIQDHYTVVVVGSGYGGGIAASRLARAGQKVCLLERGKERQPGEYPDTEIEAVEEMQADTPEGRLNARNGLFDMRFYDDINVLVGCGLGGTSLINANVSIRADPRLFDDARWPTALKADLPTLVEDGYRRAFDMLKPNPVPAAVKLAKLSAMEKSGAAMGAPVRRTDINVTFEELPGGVNHVGVEQPPCIHCGDCVTGCNHGSKNTTLMNYLPDAVNHGAEIYTEVEVRRVSRNANGSTPCTTGSSTHDGSVRRARGGDHGRRGDHLGAGRWAPPRSCCARKPPGCRRRTGSASGFTGNGDVLGFAYNCDDADQRRRVGAPRRQSCGLQARRPRGTVHHLRHRPARHQRPQPGDDDRGRRAARPDRRPPAHLAGGGSGCDRHRHRRGGRATSSARSGARS